MTGTGTVPQLTDRVFCVRSLVLLVRSAFEISGVATGTIGLIGPVCPGCRLTVACMATQTHNTRVVITRIVAGRVRKRNGRPGECVMAIITL